MIAIIDLDAMAMKTMILWLDTQKWRIADAWSFIAGMHACMECERVKRLWLYIVLWACSR